MSLSHLGLIPIVFLSWTLLLTMAANVIGWAMYHAWMMALSCGRLIHRSKHWQPVQRNEHAGLLTAEEGHIARSGTGGTIGCFAVWSTGASQKCNTYASDYPLLQGSLARSCRGLYRISLWLRHPLMHVSGPSQKFHVTCCFCQNNDCYATVLSIPTTVMDRLIAQCNWDQYMASRLQSGASASRDAAPIVHMKADCILPSTSGQLPGQWLNPLPEHNTVACYGQYPSATASTLLMSSLACHSILPITLLT